MCELYRKVLLSLSTSERFCLCPEQRQRSSSVMAADASNRYVAQQNIEPIVDVPLEVLATFMRKHFKLGRFFRHMDLTKGRLLLSREMATANPEDAEEEVLMIESGQLVPTE